MFVRLVFALVFACIFAACGDDSSSSVSPEPSDDSSSSVIPASSGDESSSSQKNSNKGKSSSSVEKSKSSSSEGKQASSSSSSKKDEKSSSSVEKVKESSSSVKPSSSDAESSSSEEVKQSSSSVVASSSSVVEESSSSEYVPYNHYTDLGSVTVSKSEYKQFTDTRNGRSYFYLTINGKDKDNKPASVTVMAENLNIGVMVDGKKDQTDDSKVERYCYNNDTTNCDKYGGLYQWAEMMQLPSECNTKSCADLIKPNHQGICPNGWRLLTEDDFYIILHADGNDAGAKGVRATSFGGLNFSGYSLIGAGYNWDYVFKRLNESSYWFYPEEEVEDPQMGALAGYQTKSLVANGAQYTYKTNAFSVRCVMVE